MHTKRALLLLVATMLLTGCSVVAPPSQDENAKPISVAATFYPWAYFLQRIGGEHVRVTSIVPNGVEPHDFEPGPGDVDTIRSAKLFVYNGAGMDAWAEKLASDLGSVPVRGIRIMDLVPTAQVNGEIDPHFWLDPVEVKTVVSALTQELSSIDPVHTSLYEDNARGVMSELAGLDTSFRTGLSHCSLSTVVTSHAAFGYLASRYGFTQVPVAGISPENEPSIAALRAITDLVRIKGIRFIFSEPLSSQRLSETLSRETGASILVFNPIEGLTDVERSGGEDYFSIMRKNLEALRTGMGCR